MPRQNRSVNAAPRDGRDDVLVSSFKPALPAHFTLKKTNRPASGVLRRREDRWLLGYQICLYLLFAGIFVLFSRVSVVWQIALWWIGAVLTMRYEGLLHWCVHTPIFRTKRLNKLHRLSFCVIPPPVVFYRIEHFNHHQLENAASDPSTTLAESGRSHYGIFRYMLEGLTRPGFFPFYRRMSPSERRECILSLGLTLALAIGLFMIDAYATLIFWIPVTWIASFPLVALLNYVDHVPGDPGEAFRYATYAETRTPYQRLLSLIDLHNFTYHLSHHRFPQVHWADLGDLHAASLDDYKRNGSPVTYGLNSSLVFNPVAFLTMIYRLQRDRDRALMPVSSVYGSSRSGLAL